MVSCGWFGGGPVVCRFLLCRVCVGVLRGLVSSGDSAVAVLGGFLVLCGRGVPFRQVSLVLRV